MQKIGFASNLVPQTSGFIKNMEPLHSWNVSEKEAIQIQEALADRIILKKLPSAVKTIGGGDVAYSKEGDLLYGAMVVLSFPDMKILEAATADGKIPFPYVPTLLSFREGPVLTKTFNLLKIKPDIMIYDGQGIAHPRRMGLASHMGLWLNVPSIGCAKTPLTGHRGFTSPGHSKGSFEWIQREGNKVGAVLRTKEGVKPVYVSPGHRIDLMASIRIILESCRGFRIPEPLRKAHQLAERIGHSA